MSASEAPTTPRSIALSSGAQRILSVFAVLGLVSFVASLLTAPQRAWADVLMVSHFMLELSLAATVFLAVHYVAGASWNVAVRRIPEAMARLVPLGAAGVLLVLLIHPELYPWFGQPVESGGVHAFKQAWLNRPFFLARAVVYVACWTSFAVALTSTSRRQDQDGDPRLARRAVRLSAAFLVVFAVTLVPASFDWIMSLEPEWYSSIFGFYDFASMFLAGLAAIAILVLWAHRLAPGGLRTTQAHLHDLGTLIFAFSTFWAYLWFSQYMLIWYGNIPEETTYYVDRLHGGWEGLFFLNLALNWAVPFAVLIRRRAKSSPPMLLGAALSVLAGRLLDLYLAVLPRFVGQSPSTGVAELGMIAGAIGLFTLVFFNILGRAPLMPAGDPHLVESVGAEMSEDGGLFDA